MYQLKQNKTLGMPTLIFKEVLYVSLNMTIVKLTLS